MKILFIFGIIAVIIFISGCAQTIEITNFEQCAAAGFPVMESYPRQCSANGQTFTEIIAMEISEALTLAENTECTEKGILTGEGMYNENTNTWWLELTMKEEFIQSGCNPACVVSAVTLEAEINWRCTGLITE